MTISHDSRAILALRPAASPAGENVLRIARDRERLFFTQQIIDALRAPEADTNRDGMISMDELQACVSLNVALQTAGLQRPTIDRDNISQRLTFPLLR